MDYNRLWTPTADRLDNSRMKAFMDEVNEKFGKDFQTYDELFQWSVENPVDFWGAFWHFSGIKYSIDFDEVVDDPNKMPGAKWFEGARLNFAENLLPKKDDTTAIIFRGEAEFERRISYAELYDQVHRVAEGLKKLGIKKGDRVAGFIPNMPEAIIAMLAAASIGAVWSFDHPLYIMYSSGTTGLPKSIVHSAGGTLIQHLKELMLHSNLHEEDTIFYFTTCGWMMWNWFISSLAVGSTIVCFDGNPFYPGPDALLQMAKELDVSIFGTSAKYIASLENAGVVPKDICGFPALKAILSTGSPLSNESFEYVYRDWKEDVQLSSIAGGTDIVSCFMLGNPMQPVYMGEIQCRGLGMDVDSFDDFGQSVIGKQGELVCKTAFPSMPIYFWNDPEGKKYHDAYFDVYDGIWRHGDYILLSEHGGITMFGRSDATLNPGGVRIGTAEIYNVVENMDEIEDSVVIGQRWEDDERVILFVKLNEGFTLDDDLKVKISKLIRSSCSPRHVPSIILETQGVPYTLNGKKVEIAVKKAIMGQEIKNKDALANPEVLDFYAKIRTLGE